MGKGAIQYLGFGFLDIHINLCPERVPLLCFNETQHLFIRVDKWLCL